MTDTTPAPGMAEGAERATPRPWSADCGDGQYYGIFNEDGVPIAYLVEVAGGGWLRLLPRHDGPEDDYPHWPEHEANARLIVTAVNAHGDLVAALRDMLRIARAASVGVTGNAPRIARAEAALAKAGAP